MKQQVILYNRTGYELIKKGASDDVLATYIALRTLYNQTMEEQLIDIEQINYILADEITIKHNDKRISLIKNSLIELDKLNVIKIIEVNKRKYLLDMSNLYQNIKIDVKKDIIDPFTGENIGEKKESVNNFYSVFDLSDIRKVLKDNGNKKSIFRYLFYILNFKAKNKDMYYFNMEREELTHNTKFDIRTIDDYNNILVENHILYIHKYEYKYTSTNKTVSNAYGLYEDKEKIIFECDKFIKEKLENGEIYKSKTYMNKDEENIKEFKKLSIEKEPKIESLIKKETIKPTYEQFKKWGFSEKQIQEYGIYADDLSICKKI